MLDGEGRLSLKKPVRHDLSCRRRAALAEAVLSMARLDPHTRAEMGTQARAYSLAHFDREQIFRRLEAWMVEAAGRRQISART